MQIGTTTLPVFSVVQPRDSRTQSLILKRCVAAAFLLFVLWLRIVAAMHYRVDSDEPQHLHVVWGWANGLLQYRDLFDNHSPLFQMLCAPLFRIFGERADILIPMRLAMIPLFFLCLWTVFKMGERLANRLGGLLAAVLAAFIPTFFYCSVEFRTDDLWTALWCVSMLILTLGKFEGRRAFWFGFVMGTAFATSMKTTLLVLSLGLAALCVLVLRRFAGEKFRGAQIWKPLALALLGALIVPSMLIAFFALNGALPQMYYCVILHNTMPGLGKWRSFGFHQFLLPLSIPPMLGIAWFILRSHPDRLIASRRAILLLTAVFAYMFLRSYWPLVTSQDNLPILPILVVALVPAIGWLMSLGKKFHPVLHYALPVLLIIGEMFWCARIFPFATDDAKPFADRLQEILRLVDRDQIIMDAKGETIFRQRPFYYVLEGVTMARIKHGLIDDSIPAALVATGTCVVRPARLTEIDHAFVDQNYVAVGKRILVAGKKFPQLALNTAATFTTLWPARYDVVDGNGEVDGTLDGQPIHGARTLTAGPHTLQVTKGSGPITLVWAQALERGFHPTGKIE